MDQESEPTAVRQRDSIFQPQFREDLRYWVETNRKMTAGVAIWRTDLQAAPAPDHPYCRPVSSPRMNTHFRSSSIYFCTKDRTRSTSGLSGFRSTKRLAKVLAALCCPARDKASTRSKVASAPIFF